MSTEPTSEEEAIETGKREIQVPPRWKELPLEQMLKEGWTPRVRVIKKKQYLTLRLGNKEKSLGPCSDDILDLFLEMFPQITLADFERKTAKKKSGLLSARIAKPAPLKTSVQISLTTLRYYEVLKENGYAGELSEFLNDIVVTHFTKCHGIVLPIVYTAPMMR